MSGSNKTVAEVTVHVEDREGMEITRETEEAAGRRSGGVQEAEVLPMDEESGREGLISPPAAQLSRIKV